MLHFIAVQATVPFKLNSHACCCPSRTIFPTLVGVCLLNQNEREKLTKETSAKMAKLISNLTKDKTPSNNVASPTVNRQFHTKFVP